MLEKLRKAGRVTAAQIRGYLSDMAREIRDLEARLHRLREAVGATQKRTDGQEGIHGAPAAKRSVAASRREPGRPTESATTAPAPNTAPMSRKRKFTVTPKVLASRELQGRYLPLLNKFSGKKRQRYAKLAKEKGREAAITQMTSALKK
ncbi:MAG: hypothetical protein ACXW4P_03930 [Thermoanaerobaculia bacterium]